MYAGISKGTGASGRLLWLARPAPQPWAALRLTVLQWRSSAGSEDVRSHWFLWASSWNQSLVTNTARSFRWFSSPKVLQLSFPIEYSSHSRLQRNSYILKIKGEGRDIVQWWNAWPVYTRSWVWSSAQKKKKFQINKHLISVHFFCQICLLSPIWSHKFFLFPTMQRLKNLWSFLPSLPPMP